jgi:hypothetical protein
MAINFPNSPIVGQTYTFNEKTWQWSGSYWEVFSAQTGYVTSAFNVGGANEIFSGKSGNDLYFRTLSGGTNTTVSTIGDVVKIDVSIPPDTNTFVTGFTYDNSNTFTLTRNDGVDITTSFNTVTGLTVNGTLSATTLDGNTILSGGTNLTTVIESLDTYVTGGTVSVPATDNTNSGNIGLFYKNSDGIPRTLPFEDTYTTGSTYNNGTALATFDRNNGTSYTLDLSAIDVNDTFVTGSTVSANTLTLTRNDLQDVLLLSGGSNVQFIDNGNNSITLNATTSGGGASVNLKILQLVVIQVQDNLDLMTQLQVRLQKYMLIILLIMV